MGASGVGKSSLTCRYVCGNWLDDYYYDFYLEDYYRKRIEYRGKTEELEILDADGQEEFYSMEEEYIRISNNFLLMYSIDSIQSFERVKEIYKKILRIKQDYFEQNEMNIVLVGNKCDLWNKYKDIDPIDRLQPEGMIILVYGYLHRNEKKLSVRFIPEEIKQICLSYIGKSSKDKLIQVTKKMGKQLANSWSQPSFEVPFIETSAKERIFVQDAFEHLVRLSQNAQTSNCNGAAS